jgi:hypothetical protein
MPTKNSRSLTVAMRCLASIAAVLLALGFATLPTRAQTWDPAYPVCMQSYGPQGAISCRFASMAQCRALASGRAAQCVANPYYGKRRR